MIVTEMISVRDVNILSCKVRTKHFLLDMIVCYCRINIILVINHAWPYIECPNLMKIMVFETLAIRTVLLNSCLSTLSCHATLVLVSIGHASWKKLSHKLSILNSDQLYCKSYSCLITTPHESSHQESKDSAKSENLLSEVILHSWSSDTTETHHLSFSSLI